MLVPWWGAVERLGEGCEGFLRSFAELGVLGGAVSVLEGDYAD